MKRPYKPELKVDNKPLVERKEKKIELKPYRFIGHGFNLEPTPLEMFYKTGMVTEPKIEFLNIPLLPDLQYYPNKPIINVEPFSE